MNASQWRKRQRTRRPPALPRKRFHCRLVGENDQTFLDSSFQAKRPRREIDPHFQPEGLQESSRSSKTTVTGSAFRRSAEGAKCKSLRQRPRVRRRLDNQGAESPTSIKSQTYRS